MPKDILIPNPEKLEKKRQEIINAGKENFHVITDFDRTLTKAFDSGQKTPTVIAQIRNGEYLTPDYSAKANALFDKYHPIEINPNISDSEKNAKMREWWKTHFRLLIRCGLDKKVMDEIVAKGGIEFRVGALELIDLTNEYNIPMIILSAGPEYMISAYLKKANRLHKNVHVIANSFEFDKQGKVTKVKEPIIHSMNKHETSVQDFPVYDLIKNRKNILLLGDNLSDIRMATGFDYDNLIKVGFLNYNVRESLEDFKKAFDIVIKNDAEMNYINEFVKAIANSP